MPCTGARRSYSVVRSPSTMWNDPVTSCRPSSLDLPDSSCNSMAPSGFWKCVCDGMNDSQNTWVLLRSGRRGSSEERFQRGAARRSGADPTTMFAMHVRQALRSGQQGLFRRDFPPRACKRWDHAPARVVRPEDAAWKQHRTGARGSGRRPGQAAALAHRGSSAKCWRGISTSGWAPGTR